MKQDPPALDDMAPVNGDMSAEVLYRDPESRFVCVTFGFVQKLIGSITEAAQPCRVGRLVKEATRSLVVGSQRSRSLEGAGGNIVSTPVPCPDPGLFER